MRPYWQSGDGRLTVVHGDYRDVLDGLERRSVDLLVTDPPFFLPAEVRQARRAWPRSIGNLGVMGAFFRDVVDLMAPSLKRTGAAYVFSDSTSYAVFLAALYPRFDRTQCIVWDKGKGGLGIGWRHSHELILHGAFTTTEYAGGFRQDILRAAPVLSEQRYHGSEKPVALLRGILDAHSPGVVFDPFMGSGSLLIAATISGWTAIGVDIDEANCEIAAKRLEDPPLLAAVKAEQSSLFSETAS